MERDGYPLKEILNEARADIKENKQIFLDLKEKYDTQSTGVYKDGQENRTDLNHLGKKVSGIESRLRVVELRIYAAGAIVTSVIVAINNFWK